MEGKVRLIALDMDETLLNTRCRLSPGNREALEQAAGEGIHLVIASGRVKSALPEEVLKVPGVRYAVTCNGAAVWDLQRNVKLYENGIRWEALEPVLPVICGGRRNLEVFAGGVVYAPRTMLEDPQACGVPENRVEYVRRSRCPVEDVDQALWEHRRELENINLCYADQEQRLEDWKAFAALPGLTVTSSLPYDLEIGGATTSKADGLAHLCEHLGVPAAEVMACGDNGNDVEMLRFAGVSVAMGNAEESVKRAARHVTLSCDQDGVAAAIRRYALSCAAGSAEV